MAINYWGKAAIELRYADCEHTIFIPRGHSTDHKNCYGCDPGLAKVPLPGCCESCKAKRLLASSESSADLGSTS